MRCSSLSTADSNIGGIELLRDMLGGSSHVPGFNREQDRLFRPRVVTFRHEPREQLRIVRDDASSPPYFDPAPRLGLQPDWEIILNS